MSDREGDLGEDGSRTAEDLRESARKVRNIVRSMPKGPEKDAVEQARQTISSIVYGSEQHAAAQQQFKAPNTEVEDSGTK